MAGRRVPARKGGHLPDRVGVKPTPTDIEGVRIYASINALSILFAKAEDASTPAMIVLIGMIRAAVIDYRGLRQ